jgi:leucyl-tRNA synthetase
LRKYGADSVRLFILSDSPPEKDVQWSEEGMKSSYKFIQKLWVLNQKIIAQIKENHSSDFEESLDKISNQFVRNVTNNINNFAYNKIIANFHEMYSSLNKIISKKIDKKKLIKNYKKILITMSPIIPHFSKECLELIGEKEKIEWPKINENILIESKNNFVVQINGKTRGIILADKGISEENLLIEINKISKLKSYIDGKNIKKKIFVPERLINIII